MLGFFRNDFGFGGNNGLTDFKDILGFNVQADGTRAALFALVCLALMLGFLICRTIVTSKLGMVLIAIRDAESRTRFLGYRVEILQAVRVHALGLHGGRRRRALRAAGRHHQSERIRAGQFDRGGDLGRGRRARHADRRGARRARRQLRQDLFTSGALAPYWLFVLGACSCWSRCCCRAASSAPVIAWWDREGASATRSPRRSARATTAQPPKPAE